MAPIYGTGGIRDGERLVCLGIAGLDDTGNPGTAVSKLEDVDVNRAHASCGLV